MSTNKWRNSGMLLALLGLVFSLAGTVGLGDLIPPWVDITLTGAIGVLVVMGILSTNDGRFMFSLDTPLVVRLQDHTVVVAIFAWITMTVNNVMHYFNMAPLPFDLAVVLNIILTMFTTLGVIKGGPAPNPAAAIPPTGGATDMLPVAPDMTDTFPPKEV